MIETTVAQRRGLDSERQQKETESQRRAREVNLVASGHYLKLTCLSGSGSSKVSPRKRNFNYPATLLLRFMRQTIQDRCSV